jgi:peptidoglycan/LPS O-acetylase OafA/YrhL
MHSPGGRIRSLDGLRGVAILAVLIGHLGVGDGWLATAGVSIFFVLSGFLITGLLVAERDETGRVDMPRFYARRLARLWPALVVMLALTWPVLLANGRTDVLTAGLIAAAYIGNFVPLPLEWGHTWSLAVEEQFYLLWPPLLGLFALLRVPTRWGVTGLCVAAYGYTLAVLFHSKVEYSPFLFWACLLLAGGAIRLAERVRPKPSIGICAVLGIVFLTLLPIPNKWGNHWLVPAIILPLCVIAVASSTRGGPLAAPWLESVGRFSYSLYLWHLPVYGAFDVIESGSFESAIGAVAMSLLAALLSFRFVEQPALRWRDRGYPSPLHLAHQRFSRYYAMRMGTAK